MATSGVKTIKLGEILNEIQLRIVDSIMRSKSENKVKSLKAFLGSIRPALEDTKGVLPEYLAYQIVFLWKTQIVSAASQKRREEISTLASSLRDSNKNGPDTPEKAGEATDNRSNPNNPF